MFSQEHLFSIALRRCSNIGDISFHRLVSAVGSAEKVWKFSKKDFKVYGIGLSTIKEVGNPEHLAFAEKELKFCESENIRILLRHSGDYPHLLKDCTDAPAILYCKGKLNCYSVKISIVGTRNATAYGKNFVADFLTAVAQHSLETVSGLAYGIDAEVHQQSVQNQIPTIAVLAHGLHLIYPSKHKKLAEEILSNGGALVSEFNSSQKPDKENFIQRNRIIAGLSHATIVAETGFGGGSISTATFANGYNREVYALPGRITDKYSQGCNQLIYQNKATAVSTIKNLMADLRAFDENLVIPELFPATEEMSALSGLQSSLLGVIKENTGISLDDLAEVMGQPPYKILPEILQLEILGRIRANSERKFQAV